MKQNKFPTVERRLDITPPPATGDGGGLRYNEGKPRYDLLPPEALDGLAAHYGLAGGPPAGPPKYPDRNWERGMSMCKCFASMMRHAWKWMRGHDFDDGPKGTGSHHMLAVAWNAFAIYTYHTRGIGTDDRPSRGGSPGELAAVR